MRAVLITDMARCLPRSAIAERRGAGVWKALPYEAVPLKGTMLQAEPSANAPVLTLPLKRKGWHHIWVAVGHSNMFSTDLGISFRLSGDPAWTDFLSDRRPGKPCVIMGYFKAADLDGQSLQFRVPKHFQPRFSASLAAVKLRPMTRKEVADMQKPGRRRTFPIVAADDAASHYYWRHSSTPEDIRAEVQAYAGSDVTELAWEVMWGECLRKDMAKVVGEDPETPWGQGAAAYRELVRAGHNPDQIACDHARRLGLKVILQMRVHGGLAEPPNEEDTVPGLWINERPEFRCVDHDGVVIPRLSWAFPEVQERLTGRIRKLVRQYRADGWNFIFHRCGPVVLFEKPVTERFRAEYGRKMSGIAPDDPRVTAVRCRILTEFLERLKAALNADAKADGRGPVSLRANVVATRTLNLRFGLDVAMWAAARAVDVVVPYQWGSYWESIGAESDYKYFRQCVKGTETRLYFGVKACANFPAPDAPHWPPRKMLDDARLYLKAGADGFYMWDAFWRLRDPAMRYLFLRLGRPKRYGALWREAVRMNPVFALQSVNGIRVDRFPPCMST